jgi:hypothetical protein
MSTHRFHIGYGKETEPFREIAVCMPSRLGSVADIVFSQGSEGSRHKELASILPEFELTR